AVRRALQTRGELRRVAAAARRVDWEAIGRGPLSQSAGAARAVRANLESLRPGRLRASARARLLRRARASAGGPLQVSRRALSVKPHAVVDPQARTGARPA